MSTSSEYVNQQNEENIILPGDEPSFAAASSSNNDKTGVSVDYIRTSTYPSDPNRNWYVMHATYNRESEASKHLLNHGALVFYPQKHWEKAYRSKSGKIKTKHADIALIPNTFFVYTDFQTAESFVRYNLSSNLHLDYLRFAYDKTKFTAAGKNVPLVIPKAQMDNFINLISKNIEGTELVSESDVTFRAGDPVLITGGQFEGVTGRVARIKGVTRIVVTLTGVCLAATTYIPKQFLQPLPNP